MLFRPHIVTATAIFVAASGPGLAEEGGAVALTVAGETYDFPLEASQSDWSGSESWPSINIYTRPVDEETWAKFKGFTLGFDAPSGDVSRLGATLTTADGDELTRYFADPDQTPMTFDLRMLSMEGEFMTIEGTLTATMGTSDNYGRDIDLSDTVEVSADVAVTLGPIE